jgi:copper resistance protein B
MRSLWLIPAAAASLAATAPGTAATEQFHEAHGSTLFWAGGIEADATSLDWLADGDKGTVTHWDGFAWIGGDQTKLRLESEGKSHDGDVEEHSLKALLAFNIDEFWDLGAGLRFDLEDGGRTWAAVGLHGMVPFFIETDAFVFVDGDGNTALKLEHHMDIALTQDLFLQPQVKLEAFAQDIPEMDVAAGLAHLELGLQLRYEITRKFAPYVALVYERDLGETSQISQAMGEDVESTTIRAGLRLRF